MMVERANIILVLFATVLVEIGESVSNESVLVIFSPNSDFDSSGILQLSSELNLSARHGAIEFLELSGSSCSEQRVFSLAALIYGKIFQSNRFRAIVGPSCSESAYAVAQLIKRSGVSVRHFHTSPLPAPLAAEVKDTSVGLLPPVDLLADASVALIKYANWLQVMALYQSTKIDMNFIFMNFQEQLVNNRHCMQQGEVDNKNKTDLYVFPLIGNTIHLNKVLKKSSVRIIFAMLDANAIVRVLCHSNATYPKYQWVIVKTSMKDILQMIETLGTCTAKELHEVLENALFVNYESTSQTDNITTLREQSDAILLYRNSILLALQDSKSINRVTTKANIIQWQRSRLVPVLLYSKCSLSTKEFENLTLIPSSLQVILSTVYSPLGVLFICVNCVILLVSASLHFLTLTYRNEHTVRSNSLLLLNISYIGIYMVNMTTAIYFVQKTIPITSDQVYINLCRVFLVMTSIGMTLILGSVLVKTWRLYKIFVHYMDPGKYLSDKSLASFVLCLTLVDIIICFVWFLFDPIERHDVKVGQSNEEGTKTVQDVCESRAYVEMLALLIFYQIVIVVMMMHLMCKLRKKIPKQHKNLRSTSVIRLGFLIAFGLLFGIPGYTLSHYYLRAIEFEFTMVALLFDSLQVFFIALLFLPPVRPILRGKLIQLMLKCRNC